jgi:fructose-bisphosphate aldolase class I
VNLDALNKIATRMVEPGRGILAADESTGTIKKRFDAIGVDNTEDNRRDYREMMFRAREAMTYVSGVILYDETIWQDGKDGTPLVKLIEEAGSIPGIKVDEGTRELRCSGPRSRMPGSGTAARSCASTARGRISWRSPRTASTAASPS